MVPPVLSLPPLGQLTREHRAGSTPEGTIKQENTEMSDPRGLINPERYKSLPPSLYEYIQNIPEDIEGEKK